MTLLFTDVENKRVRSDDECDVVIARASRMTSLRMNDVDMRKTNATQHSQADMRKMQHNNDKLPTHYINKIKT